MTGYGDGQVDGAPAKQAAMGCSRTDTSLENRENRTYLRLPRPAHQGQRRTRDAEAAAQGGGGDLRQNLHAVLAVA